MRKAISVVVSLLFLVAAAHTSHAIEMTWEYSVQVSATVQTSPAQITLSWPQDQYTQPSSYTIYRKAPGDASWGTGTSLSGTVTSYVDSNVTAGTPYEYQVVKVTSQYTGYGYVYSGINLPMTESRGKLLLVADNTYTANLAAELAQLQQDLVGDGWTVVRIDVNRNDSVASVKNLIKAQYAADPANVKCVFLFGHVPVPYSGNIVPDGHTPDHQGAWPADGYYGDMDGTWTDTSVNVTGQYDSRNTNVPGDGKFDQNSFPAAIKLMVGRVDLANMPGALWTGAAPTFPSELELLRNYLNKDHRFRTKQFDLPRRAVVGDFFGVRSGEAFAASGWRSFAPLVGANNVVSTPTQGTWTPTLASAPYLWAYGAGAGSFGSISGLGNSDAYYNLLTRELYNNDIKTAFTMLFGSWLGDWDSSDNIMRAVLATPSYGLACVWSGRPHWFMHHMGLGEPIGYSARLTQNNGPGGLYQNQINTAAGQVHIGLMGDPSLRMHVVAPVTNLRATTNGTGVNLSWTASTDSVQGYHVYKTTASNGAFTRLTSSPITTTSYTDTSASGSGNYMVRAVKLEVSSSGSYFNGSVGTFLNATTSGSGTNGGSTGTGNNGSGGSTNSSSIPTLTPWVDDAVPAGAVTGSSGGDSWNWVGSNPAPASGTLSSLSSTGSGLHEHYFSWATQTLTVNRGDVLYAYVYMDPNNPPTELMLQWFDGTWEHRAYWGANNINNGTPGGPSRVFMGALPAAGRWALLQVPASQVGLEGSALSGMSFSLYDGRAAWDNAGKASAVITGNNSGSSTNTTGTSTNSTGTSAGTNLQSAVTIVNPVVWLEDNLPSGATPGSEGGDSWNWVTSNPTPFSGSRSTLSSVAAGFHQYFFSWATQGLTVNQGDVLFAYVYLDPNNLPSELMLQWNDGSSWEHRAYWGANNIMSGSSGTGSRAYMGPLPPAGQWALLTVPASAVGLDGSYLNGMAFSQFGGRAAWDYTGKGSGLLTNNVSSGGNSGGNTNTNSNGSGSGTVNVTNTSVTLLNPVPWVDDSLPAGASVGSDGGDSWNWVSGNPAPFYGSKCTLSSVAPGMHEYYFSWATQTLSINSGDILFAYVYLDPANPPTELMLQFFNGTSWEHRAYWGANNINNGAFGTASRAYMGPLPPVGKWVLLTIPANRLELEGTSLNGMAFSQYDGRVAWDYVGKASGVVTNSTSGNSGSNTSGGTNNTGSVTNSVNVTVTNFTAWVDEALPAGAVTGADGGDSWNWVGSNPAPYSGSRYTSSSIAAGLHEYYFSWATATLPVASEDTLCAAVYIDPNNVPSELMLQFNDGSWEHRAYWGANNIANGAPGTVGRAYMGPLPPAGQWVLLQVPASTVGLVGSALNGMAFSQYDGKASWDYAGKFSVSTVTTNAAGGNTNPGNGGTNSVGTGTNTVGTGTNTVGSGTNTVGTSTNSAGTDTNVQNFATNSVPGVSTVDYVTLQLPKIGDNVLHIVTPTLLELKLITTQQQGAPQVSDWNLVNNGNFTAPPTGAFAVTANGSAIGVNSVGFKRRPIYAPMAKYDLRVESSLYLQLSSPISDNQNIEVRNTDGSLWQGSTRFVATVDPLRYSPAVHVNQEGYMPNYAKKAMVGYYAGSMGEVVIPASAGFKLVDANTGAQVYQGNLVQRTDTGYTYSPTPYQKVYEADFTAFNTPGEYRLVVPGMGGSLPFMIHSGVGISFARAYALGLYHQRCGTNMAMPFTRFTHDICHAAQAEVPTSAGAYPFTWNTVAGYANTINQNNPPQAAPALTSPSAQLFPFANQGPLDVSGGHHDAGDYSKYTINSASLVHYLMFAVDSLPGVAALDNLGIPESGDGISDVLQEAKWEADFLAKLQDSDGGFYFLVYPKNREYEGDVTPDHGDPQVVWPKTTSVTAASVAALAQCASSPAFRQAYPAAAASYLQKARLGWQFLMNAINRYGKNGAYQKITHYGDNFADNDELAWAACQMFLATGDASIHQQLMSWFDPADPATWRWGWWHMSECFGHAIRSYAFAVQSGRATANQLDAGYLAKCQAQITAAANDMLAFSQQNAYGSSLPTNTKAVRAAGWYFSTDQAFDLAVAYAINPQAQYMTAMLANMNYEGGCNPVNVSYVTGLGWKRQRDIVSQWALNDSHTLPPSGIPVGNIVASFGYLWNYAGLLEALSFPNGDAVTSPYAYYDRWGDSWNVNSEMVVLNQARSLGTLALIAAQSSYKTQAWRAPANATITVPSGVAPLGQPVTVSLQAPGIDLSSARITWEARDQEPAFGSTFTFTPRNNGDQWVEAEAQFPDGRRIFARATFNSNSPNSVWVDDSVPAGAATGAEGGDSWNWLNSNPTPFAGTLQHQSAIASGSHQHYFVNASATMAVGTGDVLYAWVYLDPANMPSEIMLQWNDGSWNHRAYWGANNLSYGVEGTPGRVNMGALPAPGQWVQLRVPASQVGLEGSTVNGMAFTAYGGRVSWDAAGRLNPNIGVASASVQLKANSALALRTTATPGEFTFARVGDTNLDLSVNYTLGGSAAGGIDYQLQPPGGYTSSSLVIPAGSTSATLRVVPLPSTNLVGTLQVVLTLISNLNYTIVPPPSATVAIGGNNIPASLRLGLYGATITWNSTSNHSYHVVYKDRLTDPTWTTAGRLTATNSLSSWIDPAAVTASQRFYVVAQVD